MGFPSLRADENELHLDFLCVRHKSKDVSVSELGSSSNVSVVEATRCAHCHISVDIYEARVGGVLSPCQKYARYWSFQERHSVSEMHENTEYWMNNVCRIL